MNLIESYVEPIQEQNPIKLVEFVGRTCYKSEDAITDTSCYKFIAGLITRKHYAMLEHGTLYCEVSAKGSWILNHLKEYYLPYIQLDGILNPGAISMGPNTRYIVNVVLNLSHLFNTRWNDSELIAIIRAALLKKEPYLKDAIVQAVAAQHDKGIACETVNLNEQLSPDVEVKFCPRSTVSKDLQFFTFKFTVDRGVSHELVRHRASVAQESTRYCNYSKAKFGNSITFIEPSSFRNWEPAVQGEFLNGLNTCENKYFYMLDHGHPPQEARACLPNALKTDVVLTMSRWQWEHFRNLRYKGTTGKPHPDMAFVAKDVDAYFEALDK